MTNYIRFISSVIVGGVLGYTLGAIPALLLIIALGILILTYMKEAE